MVRFGNSLVHTKGSGPDYCLDAVIEACSVACRPKCNCRIPVGSTYMAVLTPRSKKETRLI